MPDLLCAQELNALLLDQDGQILTLNGGERRAEMNVRELCHWKVSHGDGCRLWSLKEGSNFQLKNPNTHLGLRVNTKQIEEKDFLDPILFSSLIVNESPT